MNLGKILILFIFPLFLQHCEAAPSTGVATNYLTVLIDFASHTVKSMVNNWEWILDRFSSNTNGTNNGTEFEPGFKVLITNGLWYANEETESKTYLPKLPKYLWGHCAVQIDTYRFMILGGFDGGRYRHETSIFDLRTGSPSSQWTDGPPMLDSRYGFGCTKVKIGHKDYILAAGGNNPDTLVNTDKSMEYLDVSDMDSGWVRGHDLPRKNKDFQFVTTPDANEVYMIGGQFLRQYIMKWSCTGSVPDTCRFQINIDAQMERPRYGHVAIPISDEFAEEICA